MFIWSLCNKGLRDDPHEDLMNYLDAQYYGYVAHVQLTNCKQTAVIFQKCQQSAVTFQKCQQTAVTFQKCKQTADMSHVPFVRASLRAKGSDLVIPEPPEELEVDP